MKGKENWTDGSANKRQSDLKFPYIFSAELFVRRLNQSQMFQFLLALAKRSKPGRTWETFIENLQLSDLAHDVVTE